MIVNTLLSRLNHLVDPVWTEIARQNFDRVPARIMFTSTERGAGTTSLAAATAVGLARNLRVNVALVDTNLQAPALAGYLGIENELGLSDVLDDRIHVEKAVRRLETLGELRLHVLSAGSARLPLTGEFATPAAKTALTKLGEGCKYMIVDAPPLFDHSEARILLRDVDAAVLVLRAGTTRREDAQRAVRELQDSGVIVIGTLLNRVEDIDSCRPDARSSGRFCSASVRSP
jgi:Mrp family chromosome partitioning ATPase